MTAVHVTVWGRAAADAPSVVLIHGTLTWGTACFERQRSLADRYRLLVVDRRGYGSSPDIAHSDYAVDAADIVELLGEGAHVVGHSYGGVVAMLGLRCVIVSNVQVRGAVEYWRDFADSGSPTPWMPWSPRWTLDSASRIR